MAITRNHNHENNNNNAEDNTDTDTSKMTDHWVIVCAKEEDQIQSSQLLIQKRIYISIRIVA